jgi:hypothetical protein
MFYPSLYGTSGGMTGVYATAAATEAASLAREASTDVELFKHDIERLLLISEAMWTLMKREHGYADDVLIKTIEEIEQKKISAAGPALKSPPVTCPACERINMAKRLFCIYCGKPLASDPFAQ